MNTEKFKTALDVFLDTMRAFIPATLGSSWPGDYFASLRQNQKNQWQSAVARGNTEEDQIDFGNLETFAKANYSFWNPFWGDDHDGLVDMLKDIRMARNDVAHNTQLVNEEMVKDTFEKMILMAKKIGQNEEEIKLEDLKQSWHTAQKEDQNRMKLVWRKSISLQNSALFMRISYQEKRKDMQNFLQADRPRERLFDGPLAKTIAERVEKYMGHLKLLDDSGNLTSTGKTVAQTGAFTATEEGKYRIWYCLNDELLGNRILYLEREKAGTDRNSRAKHERLPFLPGDPQYWLSGSKDVDGRPFQILHTGNQEIPETLVEVGKSQQRVVVRWDWEGFEQATLHVEQGGTQNGKASVDFRQQLITLPFDLRHWLESLFPKWSFEANRLPVSFDDKLEDDSRRTFLRSATLSMTGFESIKGTNIPLMPENLADARQWRNWLVEQELEIEYVTQEGFDKIVKTMGSKPAFSSFELDSPEPLPYLKTQFEARGVANRSASFWHLAACIDLNPNR